MKNNHKQIDDKISEKSKLIAKLKKEKLTDTERLLLTHLEKMTSAFAVLDGSRHHFWQYFYHEIGQDPTLSKTKKKKLEQLAIKKLKEENDFIASFM